MSPPSQYEAGPQATASEKRERADLDALARPRMPRHVRIGKGGGRWPARPPLAPSLVHFERERLVRPHARKPVPALRRIVGDRIGLSDPVLIVPLIDDQRLGPHGLRITDRQGMALDRMVDRAPHLDDPKAAAQ